MKYENSSNVLQTKISSAKVNKKSDLITSFANNNNSKVYKYVRSLTKSHTIPSTLHHGSIVADSDTDKANVFNDYFYSVFTQASTDLSLPTKNPSHLSHISITEEDVFNSLINLDTSKAMGPDGIPPIALSKCASVLYKPFHYLYHLILKYSYLQVTGRFTRLFLFLNLEIPLKLKIIDPFLYFVTYLKFSKE